MISIIVPVYNTAPYLEECLDSLLAQSFSDIEIVIVDDGSTDGSGMICDTYAERDERILVFHTENRGLSAARNLGIDRSHGLWLMFVDSDDWVEPEFCAIPYRAALENAADLVIFDMIWYRKDSRIRDLPSLSRGVVSFDEAVDKGYVSACNKLYRRSLFDSTRFPEGRISEDCLTTHRILYNASRIMMIGNRLYHYRYREGSLWRRDTPDVLTETFRARTQRYDDLLTLGYAGKEAGTDILKRSIHFLLRTEPSDDPLYRRAEQITAESAADIEGLSAFERNCLRVFRMDRALFRILCRKSQL